jgi:hypothetical protein
MGMSIMLVPKPDRDIAVNDFINRLVKLGAGDSDQKSEIHEEVLAVLSDQDFKFVLREARQLINAQLAQSNQTSISEPQSIALEDQFLNAKTFTEQRAVLEKLDALSEEERAEVLTRAQANQSPAQRLLAELMVENLAVESYLEILSKVAKLDRSENVKFNRLLNECLSTNINANLVTRSESVNTRAVISFADIEKEAIQLLNSDLNENHPAVVFLDMVTKNINVLGIEQQQANVLRDLLGQTKSDQRVYEIISDCAQQVSTTYDKFKEQIQAELKNQVKNQGSFDRQTIKHLCFSYLTMIDTLKITSDRQPTKTIAQKKAFYNFMDLISPPFL